MGHGSEVADLRKKTDVVYITTYVCNFVLAQRCVWEWDCPWDSHGNGNEKHIHGNGSGNGNDFRGSGYVEKYMDQKFPFAIRFIILFMYFNFWNALEIKAFGLLP